MTWLETMPWILGAIATLAAITLAVVWLENRRENEEYDERQKLIQGKAWQYAATVGIIYYMGIFAGMEFEWNLRLGTSMLVFIGVVTMVLCYHIYCVVRGGCLPVFQKAGRMIGIYSVLSILQFVDFRRKQQYIEAYEVYTAYVPDTDLPDPGNGELAWICLIMSVTFAVMAVLYFIALYMESKD